MIKIWSTETALTATQTSYGILIRAQLALWVYVQCCRKVCEPFRILIYIYIMYITSNVRSHVFTLVLKIHDEEGPQKTYFFTFHWTKWFNISYLCLNIKYFDLFFQYLVWPPLDFNQAFSVAVDQSHTSAWKSQGCRWAFLHELLSSRLCTTFLLN